MYVNHVKINPSPNPGSASRIQYISPVFVWEVGEAVALVALWSSQGVVSWSLYFEI